MEILEYIAFFLSFIVAGWICKRMNQNTIGTLGAYIKRYFIVWIVTLFVLYIPIYLLS